ncbi:hypothetical protein EOM39_00905 [Candidatus Gracilibacteria bacterium]|nr:hypothetical protein [Candidatus Gracilibacteria bacterium]
MKISEYPQGYGHLPVNNKCGNTSSIVLDRVTAALKGGDLGPVFGNKRRPMSSMTSFCMMRCIYYLKLTIMNTQMS